MTDRTETLADLLTNAIGDIAAALTMGGNSKLINKWTAPYVEAVNRVDAFRPAPANGYIVTNGNGTKWRTWKSGMPEWTSDRTAATRYARRADAEAVHANDEDAWGIEVYDFRPASQPADAVEETGWLIERDPDGVFVLTYADTIGWTPDASAALRFARQIDAQVFIDEKGWKYTRIAEHRWG